MSAAEVHPEATLTPSKIELLQNWLPGQPWFVGDAADLARPAAFRFVDPDGEVGLDNMVVTSGGRAYFVPVTWRSQPLEGGALIGTLEHSVLGTRYCYDAETDPVYVAEAMRVIRTADRQAPVTDADGNPMPLTMTADGSGAQGGTVLELARALDPAADAPEGIGGVLVGHWVDVDGPRHDPLAYLRP